MSDGQTTVVMTEREILTTRVFDAPRERVFRAWTDPEELKLWWGPKGFTNTFHAFELKPGGEWRFLMHGPDGTDYPNRSVFVEIEKPQRIVFDHLSGHVFRTTATFTEKAGKTELVWSMLFKDAAEFAKVKGFVEVGNLQNLDRLAGHLALAKHNLG